MRSASALRTARTVPRPASATRAAASIELKRIPSVLRGQCDSDVRRKCDDEAIGTFVQRAGALNLARGGQVAGLGVHEDVRLRACEADHIGQLDAVVLTEAKICDQEVVWTSVQARAGLEEILGDIHMRVVRHRGGQGKQPASIRFYNQETRAIQVGELWLGRMRLCEAFAETFHACCAGAVLLLPLVSFPHDF